jgi:hypothetical protein
MPHLQLSPTTAAKAHAAALDRATRGVPTAAQYASQLQAAHAAAVARANTICARESGVISIYALGEVIAQIEADQLDHAHHLELTESITLHRVLRRLKDLLPQH